MARLIFPEDFLSQSLLFQDVKKKHDNDGVASPLNAFLVQQDIDLADDEIARSAAQGFETLRHTKARDAEKRMEKCDLLFSPVFDHMRDYFQFLKKFYKPAYARLGEWGAPITATGKINYPTDTPNRTVVFEYLKSKYDTYLPPGTSPLDPYLTQHDRSIADDNTDMENARTEYLAGKQLAKDAEEATEDRNIKMDPVNQHLHQIGGFLMGLYNNHPKKLGEWSFTVDSSPRPPKTVTTKVKLGSSKTITNIISGSSFKNIGTVALTIYKGRTATGVAITVPAGEMLGITKGMSALTIVNPSLTTTGVFSALRGL